MSKQNEQTTGKQITDEQMIRYFVGELSPAERDDLEDSCFADDELFEELQAVEAELIDDYASGALQGKQRKGFAQHLRNLPDKSRKLNLAQIIVRKTSADPKTADLPISPNSENSWLQRANFLWLRFKYQRQVNFAALVVIAATAGLWLWRESRERTAPLSQETAMEQGNAQTAPSPLLPSSNQWIKPGNQEQTSQLSDNFESNKSKPNSQVTAPPQRAAEDKKLLSNRSAQKAPLRLSSPTFVSITLTPGSERSAGKANELRLPQTVRKIQLRLLIETDGYENYEVVAKGVSGQQIWRQSNLSAFLTKDGKTVALEVPVSAAPPGTLLLTLRGTTAQGLTEEVQNYVLYVAKQ